MEAAGAILILAIIGGIIYGIIFVFVHYLMWLLIGIIAVICAALTIAALVEAEEKGSVALCALALAIAIGGYFGSSAIYHHYDSKLENRISRVSEMENKLRRQVSEIETAQQTYHDNIQSFKKEIREERQQHNVSSFANATERMKYNIRLIQETDAYWFKLADYKKSTQSGLEEAVYVGRRLEAQKNMAKVSDNGKVLGEDTDALFEKYGQYAEKFAINPKDLNLKSEEEIWRQYAAN